MKFRFKNQENIVQKNLMRKKIHKKERKMKKCRTSQAKIRKLNQIGAKEQFLKSKLVFKLVTSRKFERNLKNLSYTYQI